MIIRQEIQTEQLKQILDIIKTLVSIFTLFVPLLSSFKQKYVDEPRKFFDIIRIKKVKSYKDIAMKEYVMVASIWIINVVITMVLIEFNKPLYVLIIFFVLYLSLTGYLTTRNIKMYKSIINNSSYPYPIMGVGLLWSVYVLWSGFMIIEIFRDFKLKDLVGMSISVFIWAILTILKPDNIICKCDYEFFSLYDKSTQQTIRLCTKSIRRKKGWIIGRVDNMQGQIVYIKQENITKIIPEGGNIAWRVTD